MPSRRLVHCKSQVPNVESVGEEEEESIRMRINEGDGARVISSRSETAAATKSMSPPVSNSSPIRSRLKQPVASASRLLKRITATTSQQQPKQAQNDIQTSCKTTIGQSCKISSAKSAGKQAAVVAAAKKLASAAHIGNGDKTKSAATIKQQTRQQLAIPRKSTSVNEQKNPNQAKSAIIGAHHQDLHHQSIVGGKQQQQQPTTTTKVSPATMGQKAAHQIGSGE